MTPLRAALMVFGVLLLPVSRLAQKVGAPRICGGMGCSIGTTTPFLATGGIANRSAADRAADIINVRDFGAKCDGTTDDTLAIAAAFSAAATTQANGVTLSVPGGLCLISSAISQSVGANHSIRIEGAGPLSGFVSPNGYGLAITLTASTAGFDAANLSFVRTGSGQSGTGLAVTATNGQNSISHFENLLFTGLPTPYTASWQVGLHLTSLSAPVVQGVQTSMPNGTGAGSGFGLQLSGTDTSHFLTDAKITDSLFQGGHVAIEVDTAVQGVFIANSEGIGSDYGVYGEDTTNFTYSEELVTVANSHWNNSLAGIFLRHVNENQITGNLFLHFAPLAARAWEAVHADTSGYMTTTGNTVFGSGKGIETFFKAFGGQQLYAITGNMVITLAGPCVDLNGVSSNSTAAIAATVSGNNCEGVSASSILLGSNSFANGNIINSRAEVASAGSMIAQTVPPETSSSTPALDAIGSSQENATKIITNYAEITSARTDNRSTVGLPVSSILPKNQYYLVKIRNNAGGATVAIYPGIGDTIYGSAINTPVSSAPGSIHVFSYKGAGTTWVEEQ